MTEEFSLFERDLSIKTSDFVNFLRVLRCRMKEKYQHFPKTCRLNTRIYCENAAKNNQILILMCNIKIILKQLKIFEQRQTVGS